MYGNNESTVRELITSCITFYPKGSIVKLSFKEEKTFGGWIASLAPKFPISNPELYQSILDKVKQVLAIDFVSDRQSVREDAEKTIKEFEDSFVSKDEIMNRIRTDEDCDYDCMYDINGEPYDLASIVEPVDDTKWLENFIKGYAHYTERRGSPERGDTTFRLTEDVYMFRYAPAGNTSSGYGHLSNHCHSHTREYGFGLDYYKEEEARQEIFKLIMQHYDLEPTTSYSIPLLVEHTHTESWTDCGTEYDSYTNLLGILDIDSLKILDLKEEEELQKTV